MQPVSGVEQARTHKTGPSGPVPYTHLTPPTERMEEYRKETPMDRNGQPDEVADTVLFLASDAARFVNGALLDINGGRFLR